MSTLQDIIKSLGGDDAVAEQIGVKPRTVKSWRLGDRTPRPAQAVKIVRLAGDGVTLEDIYTGSRAA